MSTMTNSSANAGTAAASGSVPFHGDAIGFLKFQHQQIKELLNRVSMTHGKEREYAFFELRRLCAVHETAEEIVIHPESRRALPDGDSVVNMRLQEEAESKRLLCKLEAMNLESPEFEATFNIFKAINIAHAEAEEREEFDRLPAVLDAKRLDTLRGRMEMIEKIAPTRPHPMAGESATGNLLAGPFASMVDRLRDQFTTTGGK